MAINNKQRDIVMSGTVRVIGRQDDALDEAGTDWEQYKETMDEKFLRFLPGKAPTVFLCNFKYDAKAARMVNNAMLANKADDGSPALSMGAWAQTVAKVSLKDILEPDGVPTDDRVQLRKDGHGYVHDELLAKMEGWGVIDDIFNAYLYVQKRTKDAATLKNL